MIWVQIGIVVLSLFIQLATAKKSSTTKPETYDVPTVKEGTRIVRVFGTVWLDDAQQLAMKQTGTDPIRKSGGKK